MAYWKQSQVGDVRGKSLSNSDYHEVEMLETGAIHIAEVDMTTRRMEATIWVPHL